MESPFTDSISFWRKVAAGTAGVADLPPRMLLGVDVGSADETRAAVFERLPDGSVHLLDVQTLQPGDTIVAVGKP